MNPSMINNIVVPCTIDGECKNIFTTWVILLVYMNLDSNILNDFIFSR